MNLVEACPPYAVAYTDDQFDEHFTPRQQAAMAAGKSVVKRHNYGRRSVYRLPITTPPEQEPSMPTPLDDPLLDYYAQQYSDKVNVPLDTARKIVDGRPNMQSLLGRVDGDMSYAEACANAGIEVPAALPAVRVIVEPEPAEVPATEVDLTDPVAVMRDVVSGAVERGEAEPIVELPVTVMAVTEPPTFDEPISEEEDTDDPHPQRHTGDDEVPNDSEEVTEADMGQVVPIRPVQTNTLVTLTYRAKASSLTTTVVNGPPTAEGIERINARLERGLWLIPEQVGLPRPTWPDPVDHHDHPWVEVAFTQTGATAVQSRSFDELVVDIEAVPTWDGATFTPDQEAAA